MAEGGARTRQGWLWCTNPGTASGCLACLLASRCLAAGGVLLLRPSESGPPGSSGTVVMALPALGWSLPAPPFCPLNLLRFTLSAGPPSLYNT